MNNFKAMKKVLEEMDAEVAIVENNTFKRIDVEDSGGTDTTFFFDTDGKFVKDVPIAWVRNF